MDHPLDPLFDLDDRALRNGAELLDEVPLARGLGITAVRLLNDLEATATAIPFLRADDLTRQFDDGALKTEAQPEVGNLVVARVVGGEDLALDAAVSEPARHEDPGDPIEWTR